MFETIAKLNLHHYTPHSVHKLFLQEHKQTMKTRLAGMLIYTIDSAAQMPISTSICWLYKASAIHIHGYNI